MPSLQCVLQLAASAWLRQGLPRGGLLQQRRGGLLFPALLAAVALLAGAGRGQAPLLYPRSPACAETRRPQSGTRWYTHRVSHALVEARPARAT